jgi:hypothetical protein
MNPLYTLLSRTVLAVLFIAFYGLVTLRVLERATAFPDGVKEVAMFLLGALTTSVVTVVAFFFNSSQGSAEKTAVMAKLAEHE